MRNELRDRVLARLGFEAPPSTDLRGLQMIYRAWCLQVPFDNTRKMLALTTGASGSLPGIEPDDFFESWLAHGTGGTCWPTANAIFALLQAAGFEARRVAGSMMDVGTVNHGTVKVRIDDEDWLADSSMLTNDPLPLRPGVFIGADPVLPLEIESTDGTHLLWFDVPPMADSGDYLPCRLLVDPADEALFGDTYDRSRGMSPFNQRLYARRNRPGEMLLLFGNLRIARTASGTDRRPLSPDELKRSLREEIGISEAMVEAWARAGCLEASLQPGSMPTPPQRPLKRPSLRSGTVG
jgi:arylamine N-acetyltransferase